MKNVLLIRKFIILALIFLLFSGSKMSQKGTDFFYDDNPWESIPDESFRIQWDNWNEWAFFFSWQATSHPNAWMFTVGNEWYKTDQFTPTKIDDWCRINSPRVDTDSGWFIETYSSDRTTGEPWKDNIYVLDSKYIFQW